MRQWFTMKATDDSAEIVIYDEIGASFWGESVTAKQFLEDAHGSRGCQEYHATD